MMGKWKQLNNDTWKRIWQKKYTIINETVKFADLRLYNVLWHCLLELSSGVHYNYTTYTVFMYWTILMRLKDEDCDIWKLIVVTIVRGFLKWVHIRVLVKENWIKSWNGAALIVDQQPGTTDYNLLKIAMTLISKLNKALANHKDGVCKI